MDTLIDGVVAFVGFVWMLLVALWPLIVALLSGIWWLLAEYPQLRLIVIMAATVGFIVWFRDGVKNWRRKCWRCDGEGKFGSKLSENLNRPCYCCADDPGGAGRHPTIRSRIWDRIRGTSH